MITIKADEVVNQSVNPPTGTGGGIQKVPTDSDKTSAQPKDDFTKPEALKEPGQPQIEVPKPVAKELEKQGQEKLVISQSQQQPLFIVIGLVALAIALGSFAIGSQLRIRRRRH